MLILHWHPKSSGFDILPWSPPPSLPSPRHLPALTCFLSFQAVLAFASARTVCLLSARLPQGTRPASLSFLFILRTDCLWPKMDEFSLSSSPAWLFLFTRVIPCHPGSRSRPLLPGARSWVPGPRTSTETPHDSACHEKHCRGTLKQLLIES